MTLDEKKDSNDNASGEASSLTQKLVKKERREKKEQPIKEKKQDIAAKDKKKADELHTARPNDANTAAGERGEQKKVQASAPEPHHQQNPQQESHAPHAPVHASPHDHALHHEQAPTRSFDGGKGEASLDYWKIAAIILGLAFIVTLSVQSMIFVQNMRLSAQTASAMPAAPSNQGEGTAEPTDMSDHHGGSAAAPAGAPQPADTSNDPQVTLTVITDPRCATCDASQMLLVLTGQVFPKTTVKTVDLDSEEGLALIKKYAITAVPAYLYEKRVENSTNFGPVAKAMINKDDAYLIDPLATGAGKYLNPPDEDDDPVLGDKDAPVIIVEFSDFECSFCKRFHDETLPKIKEQYIRTGKVRFVYRDFPLPFHPDAQKTAEAAECADDQGQFWAYHDELFENQQALGTEKLRQYAQDLSLDMEEFNSCFDSGKHADEVKADLKDGANSGVSGTPTFFIGDELVSGAQPFSVFKAVIDAKLKE